MDKAEILANLRSSVLFGESPETVLEGIARIVRLISIDAGERLIEKGDDGDAMYIVCDGSVKVHDGDLQLSILGKGSAFGEMAALDATVRTASITAITPTRLIQLNRDDLYSLLDTEPLLSRSLIHFLCQRGKSIISDITERSLKLRGLEREFEIGRNIQEGFLPDVVPEVPGWDIAAYFKAAKEVAGDFYDIFEIGSRGKVALIVGDVCGKGVGAALFMSLFRTLLRSSISAASLAGNVDPETMDSAQLDINRILVESVVKTNNYVATTHADACMFSTLFVAVLDPEAGSLVYVNAGHEAPVVFDENGVVARLSHTGPAAGLFPGEAFLSRKIVLDPGHTLVVFTDGVTEAVDKRNEQFSDERLCGILTEEIREGSLDSALGKLVDCLKDFTGDAEQFDDITLLALKRNN